MVLYKVGKLTDEGSTEERAGVKRPPVHFREYIDEKERVEVRSYESQQAAWA